MPHASQLLRTGGGTGAPQRIIDDGYMNIYLHAIKTIRLQGPQGKHWECHPPPPGNHYVIEACNYLAHMFAFHSILQILEDLAGPAKTACLAAAALQGCQTPLQVFAGNVYSTQIVLGTRRADMMLHRVTTANASLRKVRG
jgi:hypothetical protein